MGILRRSGRVIFTAASGAAFPVMRATLPGVFRIALPWVNVWLLAKEGEAVLIDNGTVYDRKTLLDALSEACPDGYRLHSLLQTHGHCDHAGNAAYLAERFGAKVRAHTEEAVFLATRRTYIPRGLRAISLRGLLFALGEVFFPVKRRAPDILLRDGDCIDTPIGPLTVVHTPGHTPGHVAYLHAQEGWLFSGDALINVIPFLRREGLSKPLPIFSSDMAQAERSVQRIADIAPRALLPGHGPPILQDAGRAIHAFLKASC